MQILTISVQTSDIRDKILSFLKQIENQGVEILSQEDTDDYRLLAATRNEPSISFAEYLKNENQS
jgi:hypothetical protein